MDKDILIADFSDILGELEITDGELKSAEFDLRNSDNFDSMALLMFVCAIEERYTVSCSVAELVQSETRLGDIAQMILDKCEQAGYGGNS